MFPEPDLQPDFPPQPAPVRLFTRRRILGVLGGTAIGLAALPTAERLRPLLASLDPSQWARRVASSSTVKTFDLIDTDHYSAFLKSQNLRHVTISKIIASHAKERSGVRNALPPTRMWSNLVPTLRVVELLAERLGEDVKMVVSAYRTPNYNSMCPGSARNSQHLQNNALDLVFKSAPSKVAEAARELRSLGHFRGGVGLYASFTHIDTRGKNSDW